MIDLSLDLDVILRKMRKGHKAAIKQMMQKSGFHTEIYDKDNITIDKLLKFKEIHKIDAGRQTRTDASWQCMLEWIQSGCACLVMLWLDEIQDYCAGALIMMYKRAAYYASYGIIDSSLLNGHAGYIIQWDAIRYLKENNILRYEMGENYFFIDDANRDAKLLEIAKYKRGFRTVEVPKVTYQLVYRNTVVLE